MELNNTSNQQVPITAVKRLQQDLIQISKDPVPSVVVTPLPSNILEWHYVLSGADDSPYEGGWYHGKLVFPSQFPFKPPAIYMITPNGRFQCNSRLCLSISDFHPETWKPIWSVSAVLVGLASFMTEDTPTHGSINSSIKEKQKLASQSGLFNLKNPLFCDLFPDLANMIKNECEMKKSAGIMQ